MTKTLLLFKTLYRDYNAKSENEEGKKRKISGNAVATIALLPLVAVIAVAVGYVSSTLTDAKQLATMICSIVIGVQLFSMFLSMGTMFSTMYGAKDFSLLQSLPRAPHRRVRRKVCSCLRDRVQNDGDRAFALRLFDAYRASISQTARYFTARTFSCCFSRSLRPFFRFSS